VVDLTGAELHQGAPAIAGMRGADLVNTNLSAVIWSDTICPGGTNSQAYSPQTYVGHQEPFRTRKGIRQAYRASTRPRTSTTGPSGLDSVVSPTDRPAGESDHSSG